jgi:hypothetical protein
MLAPACVITFHHVGPNPNYPGLSKDDKAELLLTCILANTDPK